MTAFLAFIPPALWGWIAIFAIAAAFGFTCYVKGEQHEHDRNAETLAKIRATQDQQAKHAGEVAADRNKTIDAVVGSYEDDRNKLTAYYDRKLRAATSSASVTLPAGQVPAGTAPADAGRVPAACGDYIALEERCAVTALKLKALREAASAVERIN